MSIVNVSMFDYVDLVDGFDTDQEIGTFGDAIALSDSISSHRFLGPLVTDRIQYQDQMTYNAVLVGTMTEVLVLVDSFYHRKGVISDYFQLIDSFVGLNPLNDHLDFSDIISGFVATPFYDTLVFDDSLNYKTVLHLNFSDALTFNSSFSAFNYNYHTPVVTIIAPLNNVVFTSFNNLAPRVILPAPKFGDSFTTNFKRINKTTRGDDIIIAGEPNWHPTFLHKLEWQYLSERNLDKLRAFMKAHVGIPVDVLSHYGEHWKVIFLRPDVEFSQIGRENRTVTLDMQIVQ